MKQQPPRPRLSAKHWLIGALIVAVTVVIYALMFGVIWNLILKDSVTGDPLWVRFLRHGLPSGLGAGAASVYFNSVRKDRKSVV